MKQNFRPFPLSRWTSHLAAASVFLLLPACDNGAGRETEDTDVGRAEGRLLVNEEPQDAIFYTVPTDGGAGDPVYLRPGGQEVHANGLQIVVRGAAARLISAKAGVRETGSVRTS